jgi:uncharacterized membrane protein YdjX (TVP38/TMEM64 family)
MSSDPSIDEDTAEDIQQDVEQADEDVTRLQRWSAGIQLAILFGATGLAFAGAVYFGYINPDITVTATVNAGWIIEYAIIGFVAAFLLYVFTLIIIWLPGSVLSLLGGLAFGAAKAGGYIDEDTE